MFHRFLVFFKASRKFAFGFPDITLVTIFAWDRVTASLPRTVPYVQLCLRVKLSNLVGKSLETVLCVNFS